MIIVLLANGFEEIEALTPVDMLRRAGLEVKTVGVSGRAPTGAHGIAVVCDALPEEIDLSKVTMAIFPGGMPGATNLDKSKFTDKVISAVIKNNGHLAAICAAPLILGRRGLLEGIKATCYPGFEKELRGAIITDCGCVTDAGITTAKAMGSALDFAEELIAICKSKSEAEKVSAAIYRSNIPTAVNNEVSEDETPIEEAPAAPDYSDYTLPSLDLLYPAENKSETDADGEIQDKIDTIQRTLSDFNISASVTCAVRGPRLTRYEVVPSGGTKVSKILNVCDDIALSLAAGPIRIEAPIPGKSAVGIEIPNKQPDIVRLRELLETEEFRASDSVTMAAIGKDIEGKLLLQDVSKMPHMLVCGATGTGKSIFINSVITSMLYKAKPDELKLVLIDPKQVEFTAYKNIPHLLMPVIHGAKESAAALKWIINEMERRYSLFIDCNIRNLQAYNEAVGKEAALPKIVIVIDELADLMLQVKDHIEMLITRIAQKARAAGIYMIIGTQRPSPYVITGLIKANIPSRIAFKVASQVDSKILIEFSGAEKLLGKGDALYAPSGSPKPYRVQCAYISDDEVFALTEYIKSTAGEAVYDPKIIDYVNDEAKKVGPAYTRYRNEDDEDAEVGYLNDIAFLNAVSLAVRERKISTSRIQRELSIGYGKAAKFIDIMEEMGIVSEANGMRPRDALITEDEWRDKLQRSILD